MDKYFGSKGTEAVKGSVMGCIQAILMIGGKEFAGTLEANNLQVH